MADEPKRKEPFVSKGDRPEVKLKPDTPLSELRVRDLAAIIGAVTKNPNFEVGKTPLKDFFDKDFPEEAKDFIKEIKPEKFEKNELKELKGEKLEKYEKLEKFEKAEKLEKPEIKELKFEKIEIQEPVFDPRRLPIPDPRIEQLIQTVAGLTQQVGQLANQVEELRKRAQR
jgi:hypothetical protein